MRVGLVAVTQRRDEGKPALPASQGQLPFSARPSLAASTSPSCLARPRPPVAVWIAPRSGRLGSSVSDLHIDLRGRTEQTDRPCIRTCQVAAGPVTIGHQTRRRFKVRAHIRINLAQPYAGSPRRPHSSQDSWASVRVLTSATSPITLWVISNLLTGASARAAGRCSQNCRR